MSIKLYADENISKALVLVLREIGFDVLTAFEAQQANQGIDDASVIAFAHQQRRAVLTFNRKDFITLHPISQPHSGIVTCRVDADKQTLAQRIRQKLSEYSSLDNQLIRVGKHI